MLGLTGRVLHLAAWAICSLATTAEMTNVNQNVQSDMTSPVPTAVIVVDRNALACGSFMGFGAEWDPGFWREWNIEAGVTERDWDLVVRRIRWMKLPVVRMMMQVKWCRDNQGRFDWDRPEMRNLYRYLDVCQKQGITVLLTDWGCEPGWLRVPDIADVADPRYAAAIGTYMDHLVHRKGYDCIKYFIMVNEPNFEVRDFARWKKGVEQVMAEFGRRGLDKKVVFTGSDESADETWHRRAVDQLHDILGAYDIHCYARKEQVRSGELLGFYRTQWNYALEKDPAARAKPMIVGEAGIHSDGFSAASNPLHLDYEYGLDMADYAVQAAGAGSWAVLAWMLDDSSHKDFTWGMWRNKQGRFEPKPWFYPWSLLCRTVPAGAKVYVIEPVADLRVLAASIDTGNGQAWTFCLVNRSGKARSVRLRVPGGKPATFRHYIYSRDKAAADEDGLPVPVEIRSGNPAEGVEITCPADGVGFVTSVDPQ